MPEYTDVGQRDNYRWSSLPNNDDFSTDTYIIHNEDNTSNSASVSNQLVVVGALIDLSLLASNLEHFKFTLEGGQAVNDERDAWKFWVVITLLSVSIILQLLLAALFFYLIVLKRSQSRLNKPAIIFGIIALIAGFNLIITSLGDREELMKIVKYNCNARYPTRNLTTDPPTNYYG